MHAISSYRGNRPTNKQTQPHTHRQDRLQYTAPQLARSVTNDDVNSPSAHQHAEAGRWFCLRRLRDAGTTHSRRVRRSPERPSASGHACCRASTSTEYSLQECCLSGSPAAEFTQLSYDSMGTGSRGLVGGLATLPQGNVSE